MSTVLAVQSSGCPEFRAGEHALLKTLLYPTKATDQIGNSLAFGRLDPGNRFKRHRLTASEVSDSLGSWGALHPPSQDLSAEASAKAEATAARPS